MEYRTAALKLYWLSWLRSKTLAPNSSARLKIAPVFTRESAVQIETTANLIFESDLTELFRAALEIHLEKSPPGDL